MRVRVRARICVRVCSIRAKNYKKAAKIAFALQQPLAMLGLCVVLRCVACMHARAFASQQPLAMRAIACAF